MPKSQKARIGLRFLLCAAVLCFATSAFGGVVTFPTTDGFHCGLYQGSYSWGGGWPNTEITDCTSTSVVGGLTGNPNVMGVSFGMGAGVDWHVGAGETNLYPNLNPTPESPYGFMQADSLVMLSDGIVGGTDGFTSGSDAIPLHFDFYITGPSDCSDYACAARVSWSLMMMVVGPAVSGGERVEFSVAGTGTGHFSGDGVQHVNSITVGQEMKVLAIMGLTAEVNSDTDAKFNVFVPESASFDFQADETSTPEPATLGLLASGLIALALKRKKSA
jgi:hypothetical protein